MEIDKIDGKLRRKVSRDNTRQQKYDTFERHCSRECVKKLKAKPYALIYTKKVRELNEQRVKSQEKEDAAARIFKE